MNVRDIVLFVAGCAMIPLVAGCGGGEPVGDVAGEVLFDGQAVPAGMVSFESTDAAAPPRNAPIQNGKYEAAALPPGKYLVRISAGQESQAPPDIHSSPNLQGPEAKDTKFVPLLPQQWNVNSKLSVEVKPGKNTFHFRGDKSGEPRVETGANGS